MMSVDEPAAAAFDACVGSSDTVLDNNGDEVAVDVGG